MQSKSDCQKFHAKKRARERFGIILNRHVKRYFIQCIKHEVKSNIVLYIDQSARVKHYLMMYEGKLIQFVYDAVRENIVTFLIPDEEAISFFNNSGKGRKWNNHKS